MDEWQLQKKLSAESAILMDNLRQASVLLAFTVQLAEQELDRLQAQATLVKKLATEIRALEQD